MQVEDALKSRHAVRDFTDQPVTKETIQEIVRLAQQTPSWVNSEPWRVYAATADPNSPGVFRAGRPKGGNQPGP